MSTPIHQQHEQTAPQSLSVAVITVSDTRTLATDTGGQTVIDHLLAAGHVLHSRHIIRDDPQPMRDLLLALAEELDLSAILLTGARALAAGIRRSKR